MNKRIKKIIAIALTVSSLYTVSPVSNFMTTKAYASTSDSQLRSMYLSDGNIDFSSSTYSYTVRVGSSVDDITISAKPRNSSSKVEIDGTTVDDNDNYKDTVSLDKGSNTIKIKVTDDDNKTRTYTLTVYRGTSSSSYDDVYLRSLYLSNGNIDFDKDDTSYYVNVNSSVDEIKITAKPDDSDDTVRIDGSTVDDDDDYKRTVSLDRGSNKIEIEVEDDDSSDSRTYTLNINRGYSSGTTNDKYLDELSINDSNISLEDNKTSYNVTTKDSVYEIKVKAVVSDSNIYDAIINGSKVDSSDDYEKEVSLNKGRNEITIQIKDAYGKLLRTYALTVIRGADNIKANQWVEVSGRYIYNDSQGNPMKNTFFSDNSTSKNYYLDQDGYRVTGWKSIGGNWYYFDSDGAMIKGWKYINGAWYYLQNSGIMVTGWLKSDSDGVWYYLNANGTMRTGWILDGEKYYYFNSNGSMAHDTTIGGYKLGSNGAWIR